MTGTLPRGATARARATPGVRSPVRRPPVCRSGERRHEATEVTGSRGSPASARSAAPRKSAAATLLHPNSRTFSETPSRARISRGSQPGSKRILKTGACCELPLARRLWVPAGGAAGDHPPWGRRGSAPESFGPVSGQPHRLAGALVRSRSWPSAGWHSRALAPVAVWCGARRS
jgi:hypothetical protein